MGSRGGIVGLVCAAAIAAGCRHEPSTREKFETRFGHAPYCAVGSGPDDCMGLARLENDPAKQLEWLELACSAGSGDACVEAVGSWDHPREGVDAAMAIAKLTRACQSGGPGDACSQLLYRKVSPMSFVLGDGKSLDAPTLRIAERACFLRSQRPPMLGFGPTACFYVGRASLDGLAGQPKDLGRALFALEAACEQELESGIKKAGPSCYYAARVYEGQPLVGDDVPDAKPIDTAKAAQLLKRACDNQQSDACSRLARNR